MDFTSIFTNIHVVFCCQTVVANKSKEHSLGKKYYLSLTWAIETEINDDKRRYKR